MSKTPIENANVLLEGSMPLTKEDKKLFRYFGENAKILPPYRILNPQRISIGDRSAIREGCHINAFLDLSFLLDYVASTYQQDFRREDYLYDSHIDIGRENQIGRFVFMSCTASITLEDNVLLSERIFLGDNNHSSTHQHVPVMQQPNQAGRPVRIGAGSWLGVGAVILAGTTLGRNCVVGANSVCRGGNFPDNAVIASESAKIIGNRGGKHE